MLKKFLRDLPWNNDHATRELEKFYEVEQQRRCTLKRPMYAMVGILLGLWAHLCRWDEDLFLPLMSLRLQTIWTLLPQRPTKKVVYMKRVLFIFIVLFQLRTVCRQPQPTYSFTSKSFTTHHRIPPISLQVHDCNDASLSLAFPKLKRSFLKPFYYIWNQVD